MGVISGLAHRPSFRGIVGDLRGTLSGGCRSFTGSRRRRTGRNPPHAGIAKFPYQE
jgi:hypothetical protein